MLTTPRPEPRSCSALARPPAVPPAPAPGPALGRALGGAAEGAPAGRGERVAGGERAAVDVEPLGVDRAERLVAAEALATEDRVRPRLERAQDLGRERLVDL